MCIEGERVRPKRGGGLIMDSPFGVTGKEEGPTRHVKRRKIERADSRGAGGFILGTAHEWEKEKSKNKVGWRKRGEVALLQGSLSLEGWGGVVDTGGRKLAFSCHAPRSKPDAAVCCVGGTKKNLHVDLKKSGHGAL